MILQLTCVKLKVDVSPVHGSNAVKDFPSSLLLTANTQ